MLMNKCGTSGAIPGLNGLNDAGVDLAHWARIVSVDTKPEMGFETKANPLFLTCSSGLAEIIYLKGMSSANNQWRFVDVCF